MSAPLDPDEVREAAAAAARELAAREAQDLVDGLNELLDQ